MNNSEQPLVSSRKKIKISRLNNANKAVFTELGRTRRHNFRTILDL